MPISITYPLSLRDIAKHWAQDLRATRSRDTPEELLSVLAQAVMLTSELKVVASDAGISETIRRDWMRAFSAAEAECAGMTMVLTIPSLRVSREEFMRWVEKRGYQRPTFWDVQQAPPTVQATTAAFSVRKVKPVERIASERNRVKGLMKADLDAGKVTIEDLKRNKIAWAAKYSTGATTARDAALELEAELEQKS